MLLFVEIYKYIKLGERNIDMKKKKLKVLVNLSTVVVGTLGVALGFMESNGYAQNKEGSQEQVSIQSRADVNILDTGKLEGIVTPYISGVPNTGKVTLHYSSTMFGVGVLDTSYFVIGLPSEFKYVAAQSGGLAASVTATIRTPLFNHKYTMHETNVMADRITFKNPKMNYVVRNKAVVDVEIDYGKVLQKHPNIPIEDGYYEFKALLSRNNLIDISLLGNNIGHWKDNGGTAIVDHK